MPDRERKPGPTLAQRRAWGRVGALKVHGSGRTNVKPAHEALRLKWEREADPDGVLDPETRARRGAMLRRAFLIEQSLKAAEGRRRNRKAPPAIGTPGGATPREGTTNARRPAA